MQIPTDAADAHIQASPFLFGKYFQSIVYFKGLRQTDMPQSFYPYSLLFIAVIPRAVI